MTVNWSGFALLSALVLLDSVYGVQHRYSGTSSGPSCACPYLCVTTSECAARLAYYGTEEVLFQCEEGKVCCPPTRQPLPGRRRAFNHVLRNDCIEEVDRRNEDRTPTYVQTPSYAVSETPVPSTTTERPKGYFLVPSGIYVHIDAAKVPQQQAVPGTTPTTVQRPMSVKKSTLVPYLGNRPEDLRKRQPSLSAHRNFRLLPNESYCGANNFANRITEGEEVSLGEYPWMVLTGIKDRYGNYRWNCGGTLINGWYVLTAAHCLGIDNRTIEFVRLGEHNLANATDCLRDLCLEPPEDIRIAEIIPHEKWNTTTIKNDIALLRLSRNPLTTGKSNIQPICLPTNIEKLNITSVTKYEVAGWGKTDWNADEGSDVLRKASISGVRREECNICKDKKKQQYCPITDTQLCVQGWKAVDVCKGDSGGPLMLTRLNIYQIGITSFKGSEYCGAENIPSIFTKVESYLPWILDNIRE